MLPIGGAMHQTDDIPAGPGSTKLYLYVEDVGKAMEVCCPPSGLGDTG